MKKDKRTPKDEFRTEYKRAEFTGPMVRGKYGHRLREESIIVVLKPEVAAVIPNEDAVNKGLQSLIDVAEAMTHPTKHSSRRDKKRNAA